MSAMGIKVHYRIGSLEMFLVWITLVQVVHYRIGSLEKQQENPNPT